MKTAGKPVDSLTTANLEAIKEMAKTLAYTRNGQLVEEFLRSILTPNELNTVAERWELVKLIDQGMSQRKISEKLGLSLCKITRGSKELKKENSVFAEMIKLYRKLVR